MKHPFFLKYGQSLTVNALKHLIDQSEERILRIDQSKNVSKYYVDHSLSLSLSLSLWSIIVTWIYSRGLIIPYCKNISLCVSNVKHIFPSLYGASAI